MSSTPPQPAGPYPPQAMYQPPQKKSHAWIWILVIFLIVIPVLFVGGCLALFGKAASDVDKDKKRERTVVYRVTSDGPVSISYGPLGSSSSVESKGGAWTKETKIKGFDITSVTVTTDLTSKGGKVSCEVLVDGVSKERKEASGNPASVICTANS